MKGVERQETPGNAQSFLVCTIVNPFILDLAIVSIGNIYLYHTLS